MNENFAEFELLILQIFDKFFDAEIISLARCIDLSIQ